jgi:hypothetical protein
MQASDKGLPRGPSEAFLLAWLSDEIKKGFAQEMQIPFLFRL